MDRVCSTDVGDKKCTHSLEENISAKMDLSLYKYKQNGTGKG
jgi:hypothetical protein